MGYSIFSHSHLHLVGCKSNGQGRMVLMNLQKAFDIINQKTLLKKCVLLDFQQLNCLVSWFESYFCLPVFKWVSKINSPLLQVPTAEWHNNQQDFPCCGSPPASQKFAHPPTGKIPPVDSSRHTTTTTTKFLFSANTKG